MEESKNNQSFFKMEDICLVDLPDSGSSSSSSSGLRIVPGFNLNCSSCPENQSECVHVLKM